MTPVDFARFMRGLVIVSMVPLWIFAGYISYWWAISYAKKPSSITAMYLLEDRPYHAGETIEVIFDATRNMSCTVDADWYIKVGEKRDRERKLTSERLVYKVESSVTVARDTPIQLPPWLRPGKYPIFPITRFHCTPFDFFDRIFERPPLWVTVVE